MRIRHKTPTSAGFRTAVLEPGYAAEVEEHARRGERAYARAVERLRVAEARREDARIAASCAAAGKRLRRELERARELAEIEVEQRRAELRDVHRMMRTSPASQVHRGRKQYRPPVPAPGELL